MLNHMLAEPGLFKTVNVAHLEEMSDNNVAAFAQIVVKNFLSTVPMPPKK